MADQFKLDKGFEEVPLDEGFAEVPLDGKPRDIASVISNKAADTAKNLKESGVAAGSSLIQDAGDLGAGLVQGATLDFGDEIQGAAQGGADYLKDLITSGKGQSFLEHYRKRQQEAEKGYKEASERSPWLYGAGQLGGAVGAGLATGGAGLTLGAGKVGLKEALKYGGKKALAAELATRAGGLGAVGALQGAGASEGNLDSEAGTSKVLADALGGGLFGATLGVGTSVVGDGLNIPAISDSIVGKSSAAGKKLGQIVDDSPLLRQMRKAKDKGLAGEAFNEGEESLGRIAREQTRAQKDITSQFVKGEDILGKELGDLIDVASNAGAKINIDPAMQETVEGLKDVLERNQNYVGKSETKKIVAELSKLYNRDLDPRAAYNLRKDIANLAEKIDVPELKAVANRFQLGIRNSLEEAIPGLKDASRRFADFRRAGSETVLSKGQPSEIADVYMGNLKNPELQLSKGVTEMLGNLTTPGTGKAETRRTFSQLIDNLKKFEEKNPGAMQRMGFGSVDEFQKKLLDKGDDFAISRQILGYDPQSSPVSNIKQMALGGAKSGRGFLIGSANLLGRVQNNLRGKNPLVGKQLYSAPEDALRGVADALDKEGLTSLASGLRKGLDQKNTSLKNAALFSIMQNPKARLLISGEDVEGDDK